MTDAPDTATQRLGEYERLFAEALIGRERTDGGIRFRFRARPGLEEWVRDLAARERACCGFFSFVVTVHDDEVWWDASVVDDDVARRVLDEFSRLPETVTDGSTALLERFSAQGLHLMIDDGGASRPATTAEPDWEPVTSEPKAVVRRLVDEVINGRDLGVLDEIAAPKLAPKLRRAFGEFRAAFPDWHQDLVEIVAEDRTVVARFRCTGTHRGAWQGLEPTGRTMRVDEVYFFGIADGRIHRTWGLEDTWTRLRQLRGDDAELGQLGSLS
jgi:hypothetical protein